MEVFSLAARKGLIIVHTGSGKGKTTAALRAAGQGLKVLMVQFIKGSWHYGELDAAKMLGNGRFKVLPMIAESIIRRPDLYDMV